jgi:hypothetical protein
MTLLNFQKIAQHFLGEVKVLVPKRILRQGEICRQVLLRDCGMAESGNENEPATKGKEVTEVSLVAGW